MTEAGLTKDRSNQATSMTGLTHSVVGVAASMVVASVQGIKGGSGFIPASLAVLGSLLPDIDTPGRLANRILWGPRMEKGLGRRLLWAAIWIGILCALLRWIEPAFHEPIVSWAKNDPTYRYLWFAMYYFSMFARAFPVYLVAKALLDDVVQYRGVMHSIVALLVFGLATWRFLQGALWIPFAVGYGLHIGLDMLTPAGVQLFWPRPGNIGIGVVRHGWVEAFIVFVAGAGTVYLFAKGILH
ncbi:MAG: metal-dependent hydrolase [Anaerolineae bacterium]